MKFSKARADQIVADMNAGAGLQRAADMNHVGRTTIWNWRRQGRAAGRGAKWEFDRQVSAIEAEHIAAAEATVKGLMRDRRDRRTALNAATWFLERRAPDEYGRHDKITLEVQQQMAAALLDDLRNALDAGTYARVLQALDPSGGAAEAHLERIN